MEVKVTSLGGLDFVAESRGHRVMTSAPRSVGGEDNAMMPTELLLASLGTCAGYYAAQYLQKQGLLLDGLSVRVEADVLKRPGRVANFTVEVDAPGAPPAARDAILAEVEHCTVHNTLSRAQWVGIDVRVKQARAA